MPCSFLIFLVSSQPLALRTLVLRQIQPGTEWSTHRLPDGAEKKGGRGGNPDEVPGDPGEGFSFQEKQGNCGFEFSIGNGSWVN